MSRASSSACTSRGWAAVCVAPLVAGASHAGGPVIGWGSSVPASVDGSAGAASAVSAGEDHICAIQAETGNVVCWGNDGDGEASPPAAVDGTAGTASAITAGYLHTLAIQVPAASPPQLPALSPWSQLVLVVGLIGIGPGVRRWKRLRSR